MFRSCSKTFLLGRGFNARVAGAAEGENSASAVLYFLPPMQN